MVAESLSSGYYHMRVMVTEHPKDRAVLDASYHDEIVDHLMEETTSPNPPVLLKIDSLYCRPQPDHSSGDSHDAIRKPSLGLPPSLIDKTTLAPPEETAVLIAKPDTATRLLKLFNPTVGRTPEFTQWS